MEWKLNIAKSRKEGKVIINRARSARRRGGRDPEPTRNIQLLTTVPNTVMLKSKPAPCATSADSPLLPEGPILISNGLNDFDANPTARQLRSLTRRSKVASIFLFIARFVGFPVLGSEFTRPLLLRILIKLQFSTLMTKPILLNK